MRTRKKKQDDLPVGTTVVFRDQIGQCHGCRFNDHAVAVFLFEGLQRAGIDAVMIATQDANEPSFVSPDATVVLGKEAQHRLTHAAAFQKMTPAELLAEGIFERTEKTP